MITGYAHFAQLAESLQWDETAIDFSADREAWPQLTEAENAQVLGLIAGFVIAETSVSGQLGAYEAAASDDSMAAVFQAQARDEARHARFFDRVCAEVAGVPGALPAQRRDALHAHVGDELVDLFEHRLPATARRLAEDHAGLTAAVGMYHMVIEGVVLLAGQHAMLDALEGLSVGLPGVRRGMELVLRDERWHIGFGSRVVQSAAIGREEADALLEQGETAAKVWGDLITAEAIETAVRQHRRRLKAAGIKFW
ncbi:ribonucleotide-diphosphate reductase subunit beta [Pseudonocardia sp. KRD-184]|uniref:Ribonucleotide-diphosphate reductase subunit beta n=1 Tax=Pseudonocardia oceani TaxID=2792013 RepID=A0ABS6UH42_9PSEU|nr:ribonucleotide-diphosphate reductase subunit beta [Pseudonocardia oceani]MBW0090975.1 ribonucleotide-diphosphate reductase subunit beta [Pseudonocardia oceani]MBW0096261.1 ribonucleotide-diphosphate reductase subunit beta [Pseudonocardia oceani]MBW0109860.1 ribonucleotide-diphosphate reductase subunit beta [Pseudonocardia oceani]MBW0120140.1 ribonucleotide-diphosphate reductase subunit beta [Pseudonocardia oceani]MBW0131560.1 ribonucleotide-diphosphate reductase subunit beta [Pseudonocardia